MPSFFINKSVSSGPLSRPPLPAYLGRLFEPLYRLAITRRNRRFDRGVAGGAVTCLDLPVISVGNLSVGGTGKTPMVAHIVSTLLRENPEPPPPPRGGAAGEVMGGRAKRESEGVCDDVRLIRPCIAMRGYTPARPSHVRRGRGATHAPDETDACRRMFPGLPIVAQPDRIAGIRHLIRQSDPDTAPTCIILDDGFQHRRLARDLDIVLIDASRSPLRDHLLPRGWLREPVENLRRADLVVITHAELVSPEELAALEFGLRAVTGRDPEAVARHIWTGLRAGDGEHEDLLPLDHLLGKRIAAACAIGNPDGFLHSLRATLNADGGTTGEQGALVGAMVLPDHDPFGPEVVSALCRLASEERADAIVVTDKDWSKLRHLPPDTFGGTPVIRPILSMVFDRGQVELDARVLAVATR